MLASQQLTVSCTGFSDAFPPGPTAATSIDFRVEITNTGFATLSLTPSISDLTLSGAGLGTVTVSGVSPSSISLAPGQSQVVNYSFSGAASPNGGLSIKANWSSSGAVCSDSIVTRQTYELTSANTYYLKNDSGTAEQALADAGKTVDDLISAQDLDEIWNNTNSNTVNKIAAILGVTLTLPTVNGVNLTARANSTNAHRIIMPKTDFDLNTSNNLVIKDLPLTQGSGYGWLLIFK